MTSIRSSRTPSRRPWATWAARERSFAPSSSGSCRPTRGPRESEGLRPLRHDPSQCQRYADGAFGLHHRPDKKIKLTITYPASTGRNFDEILRVIDSLQLTAKHQVATPVNWKRGEDVIIVPSVSDEEAKRKFPGGWKALKPYLRIVPQPRG